MPETRMVAIHQQIFIKLLPCVRHCFRLRGYSRSDCGDPMLVQYSIQLNTDSVSKTIFSSLPLFFVKTTKMECSLYSPCCLNPLPSSHSPLSHTGTAWSQSWAPRSQPQPLTTHFPPSFHAKARGWDDRELKNNNNKSLPKAVSRARKGATNIQGPKTRSPTSVFLKTKINLQEATAWLHPTLWQWAAPPLGVNSRWCLSRKMVRRSSRVYGENVKDPLSLFIDRPWHIKWPVCT